jgi:XTP/dITP diphosphohydrolase
MKTIYFISTNIDKIKETVDILNQNLSEKKIDSYVVKAHELKIDELQSVDFEKIVKDKAIKAYEILQRPLLVEHTGLIIPDFGNLPGGLTGVFWESIEKRLEETAKNAGIMYSEIELNMEVCKVFCEYFAGKETIAVTWLAYCDGKQIKTLSGSTNGKIPSLPGKSSRFQWDPIFYLEEEKATYSDISQENKNKISMRRKALDKFIKELEESTDE